MASFSAAAMGLKIVRMEKFVRIRNARLLVVHQTARTDVMEQTMNAMEYVQHLAHLANGVATKSVFLAHLQPSQRSHHQIKRSAPIAP
jgi:hypothetical protein